MTELFTLAANKTKINLPFNQFGDSMVYYEIIMYQDEEMREAFLLKSNESGSPLFALTGVSTNEGKLFGINKSTALQMLIQILNRITEYDIENPENEISVDDVKAAIKTLEKLPDEQLGSGDTFIQLIGHLYVLIDKDENKKTSVTIEIQVSEDNFIKPEKLNFVGYYGSDDYGQIILTDIFEKDLKNFHLIDNITVYVDYGEGRQQQYVGLVLSVRKESDSTVLLKFNTDVHSLKNTKLDLLFSENIDPRYLLDFVIRSSGWTADIEGIEKHSYPSIVLIPVHNILVGTDSIGIGNVELLSSDSDNYDVLQMKGKLKEKWHDYSFAKVHVDSKSIYEAYSQAKRQVEDALNAINHIVKQDSLFELYTTQSYTTEWNRDVFVPKPTIGSLVYARNLVTNGVVVSDMERIVEPSVLKLDDSFNEKVEKMDWYEDLIAANMDNAVSRKMKILLDSLKWLKRSWDAVDLEDQIIYSNISIEFLLSGEKAPSLLNKAIRNKIVDAAMTEFNEVFDGSEEEKNKLSKDIKQKISGALTNTPLFAKLYHLTYTLEVPITTRDKNYLNLIRKKRNDLIHGRSTESMDKMDIWKSNTIIGMIIAYKMKYKGES